MDGKKKLPRPAACPAARRGDEHQPRARAPIARSAVLHASRIKQDRQQLARTKAPWASIDAHGALVVSSCNETSLRLYCAVRWWPRPACCRNPLPTGCARRRVPRVTSITRAHIASHARAPLHAQFRR
eukprot:356154-Chlamydomonas_euryale.AAC.5